MSGSDAGCCVRGACCPVTIDGIVVERERERVQTSVEYEKATGGFAFSQSDWWSVNGRGKGDRSGFGQTRGSLVQGQWLMAQITSHESTTAETRKGNSEVGECERRLLVPGEWS